MECGTNLGHLPPELILQISGNICAAIITGTSPLPALPRSDVPRSDVGGLGQADLPCKAAKIPGQSDLSRLSKTCAHVRNVVQSLVLSLYSHDSTVGLAAFVKAIKSRPGLGQQVRGAVLPSFLDDVGANRHHGHHSDSKAEVHELLTIEAGFKLADTQLLLTLVMLVASRAPKLRFLRLLLKGYVDMTGSGLGEKLMQLPGLQVLESEKKTPTANILDFCRRAPNLEALSLPGVTPGIDKTCDFPHLRRLRIDTSRPGPHPTGYDFNVGGFAVLLQSLPNVESIDITLDPDPALSIDSQSAAIWHVPSTRKDTLKELRFVNYAPARPPRASASPRRLSLREFPKLEVVHLGDEALWALLDIEGTRMRFRAYQFPISIREVVFLEMEPLRVWIIDDLADMAKEGKFPKLETVTVRRYPPGFRNTDVLASLGSLEEQWIRASTGRFEYKGVMQQSKGMQRAFAEAVL
ncbi:hypothetical protein OQA88_7406 [Cercophora sp. LCS_1]